MVNVRFNKKCNKIVSVKLSGHAEASDDGYDMVCSAVSAVSLTIANGITEILNVKPNIGLNDGFLSLDLNTLSNAEIDSCQILLETMLLGFKNIEINYSDYIKVVIEEV